MLDYTFDILPRLKPWDSLDSDGITHPCRLGYSRRYSGFVPMGFRKTLATFRAED